MSDWFRWTFATRSRAVQFRSSPLKKPKFILNLGFFVIFISMENIRNYIKKVLEESVPSKKRIVAGALIKDVNTDKVFLLKRNDKKPIWAMVTGTVDEGEDVLDGLEREIYEELFIRPGDIRFNFVGIEHIIEKNIDLYYYEAFVENQFKPKLDEENLDYGWFSLEDLPSPLFGGLYSKVSDIINKDNVFSDVKKINENNKIRNKIRLVLEQRVMSDKYIDDIISMLSLNENDEPSPTFTWDFPEKEKKKHEIVWDTIRQKIDSSKSYVKTKEQAYEYLKRFLERIQDLPKDAKIKLVKYVIGSLVGILSMNAISSAVSEVAPEIEKDVISVVKNSYDKITNNSSNEKVEFKYPNSISDTLVEFLKKEEGIAGKPVLTAYDLGDGAYTIGYGHAIFKDTTRGDGGGKYKFLPTYENITPGVTTITEKQAEILLRDDIEVAKTGLDRVFGEWKNQKVFVKIDQHMYDAMVSMIYNMGIEKFRKSDFIQFVKKSDFGNAAKEINKIDTKNLLDAYPGLVDRRAREKEYFTTNIQNSQSDLSELRNIIRNMINESFDDNNNSIIEEEVLDETYTAQKDLEKLSNTIIKHIVRNYVLNIKHDFDSNESLNLPMSFPSAVHTNNYSGEGYEEMSEFIKDTSLMISTKKRPTSSVRASYRPSFNGGIINLFYSQEEFNSIASKIEYNNTEEEIENYLYYHFYTKFNSSLIHELQHAYDYWRSQGNAMNKKVESNDYIKSLEAKTVADLTPEEKNALNKSYERYLKLQYEINARFSEALKKLSWYKIIDLTPSGPIKEIQDWDYLYKKFKYEFYGWNVMSDKMKKRLTQRLAKSYQEVKEKLTNK